MHRTERTAPRTGPAAPHAPGDGGSVRWTLVPPPGTEQARPPWRPTADQAAVTALGPGCGPRLVVGGPGTGRSRVLVELAARRIRDGLDPDRLLVLTPSRLSAARVRDDLTAAVAATMSSPPVRAWQSYAFDLLRRARNEGLLPGVDRAPKLLSGPEQDVLVAELMAGHALGEGAAVVWPRDLQEAVGTRGFRQEVREVFDRMSEHDLAPEQLRRLGRAMDRPDWAAAAALRAEYQAVRRLRMPEAYDPAALVSEAARLLEAQPEFLRAEQERLELLLVDDLQEATPSIHRLLAVLGRGRDVVATACPDTVVQGFRGARPDLLRSLEDRLAEPGRPLRRHDLGTSLRMPPAVTEVWRRIAERVPALVRAPRALESARAEHGPGADGAAASAPGGDRPGGGGPAARAAAPGPAAAPGALGGQHPVGAVGPAGPQEAGAGAHDPEAADDGPGDRDAPDAADRGEVLTAVLSSPLHEARWIAHQVLERHLVRGVPLGDMAVIVRNGRQLEGLERQLTVLGVPVSTSAAETPVRDEPAVRPLLAALRIVTEADAARSRGDGSPGDHHGALTVQAAVELLTSRIGGASPMDLRRLRQRLRAEELADGGGRGSDDLLVEALAAPAALDAAGVRSAPARRVARMIAAGTRALHEEGATAETVLWALWEAAGVAEGWRRRALEGGPAGERADRDLDAVVALFESAERYVDHLPGASAAQFLDYVESQELPMDTLAARAPTDETVEIMTPATAAGRQWPVVFVAGVQDSVWPNTRLRGRLLGADLLTDALDLGVEQAVRTTPLSRLRQVRHDELRSFSAAVSRSSGTLVVTAAANEDEQPSEFLDLVDPPGPGAPARTPVDAPRPMTLRALVAELRQWVQRHEEDPVRAEAAARLLHRIAASPRPVPGADPGTWWGTAALSSTDPVFDDGVPVPVSPSRIEAIHRSPLDWFVAASRAEPATDLSRSLGSLVHAIAEELPESSGGELVEELDRRWHTLGLPGTWETEVQLRRARQMLRKFAQYVVDARQEHGRRLAAVEGSFDVLVRGPARDALLRGRVDRLEVDAQGRYVVVDLKTGRTKPAGAKIPEHPQLAAYQVALAAGAGAAMAGGTDEERLELPEGSVAELPGGALLVQLGTDEKTPRVQQQDPLDPQADWARLLITRAADLVAGETFTARHDQSEGTFNGHGCKLPQICPLCAEGRQVSEP
ncbi:ATP-dependent helicase [Kocuria sp. LUK]|uniref:ATP-dependent helicase n=1 Tax=Kocuria sp. LUK TaxID=2897828 RepID=UPI001E3931E4|nr:ATP-dependent DNA helicase [Kocuria sp. LUK]MCD1145762.1 ATP-dependent helicase [Kocuria sp. LUK]